MRLPLIIQAAVQTCLIWNRKRNTPPYNREVDFCWLGSTITFLSARVFRRTADSWIRRFGQIHCEGRLHAHSIDLLHPSAACLVIGSNFFCRLSVLTCYYLGLLAWPSGDECIRATITLGHLSNCPFIS